MHFLAIDERFRVPIFVFLERDPRTIGVDFGRAVREVTLEFSPLVTGRTPNSWTTGVRPEGAIGRDPEKWDQFREFTSETQVRAAGFALIEPRYVGATWETYLDAYRPEGAKRIKPTDFRADRIATTR